MRFHVPLAWELCKSVRRISKSHTEECQVQVFFSLIVCADYVGMTGSVKEITKLEKTLLSDFTLCGAEFLPDLHRFIYCLHQFMDCLCRLHRHVWKCESKFPKFDWYVR